jgi:hypothetical protein
MMHESRATSFSRQSYRVMVALSVLFLAYCIRCVNAVAADDRLCWSRDATRLLLVSIVSIEPQLPASVHIWSTFFSLTTDCACVPSGAF